MEREPYTRVFDETNPNKQSSEELDVNDMLRINKVVFLNEVFDKLGFPRIPAGQVVGWCYGEEGGYIDFCNLNTEVDIPLHFNVQGVVYHLLEREKKMLCSGFIPRERCQHFDSGECDCYTLETFRHQMSVAVELGDGIVDTTDKDGVEMKLIDALNIARNNTIAVESRGM